MITTQIAVMSLRPGVEWVMDNDDVAGIQWITEGAQPLTEAEVTKEVKRLEAEAVTTEAARVATITAARDHAATLGFTEAMLAVMYPNLAP